MNTVRTLTVALLAAALTACGEPTVIDIVKDSSVAECSAATVGDMLILYFPTTSWTAYNGEAAGTFEVRGSGELQYVASTQTAELRFLYNETTGQVTYEGATLQGVEQPAAVANQILEAMCQEARS
jgi:hypothetical protein